MRDAAADSPRCRQRVGRIRLGGICGAFVVLQITILMSMPPHARRFAAGLLTVVTVVVVTAVAMEVRFNRKQERAAEATAGVTDEPPRPGECISPLIQRAYHLARKNEVASHIAEDCDMPEAFAALIIDDVRRTASRKGRAARNSSSRRPR